MISKSLAIGYSLPLATIGFRECQQDWIPDLHLCQDARVQCTREWFPRHDFILLSFGAQLNIRTKIVGMMFLLRTQCVCVSQWRSIHQAYSIPEAHAFNVISLLWGVAVENDLNITAYLHITWQWPSMCALCISVMTFWTHTHTPAIIESETFIIFFCVWVCVCANAKCQPDHKRSIQVSALDATRRSAHSLHPAVFRASRDLYMPSRKKIPTIKHTFNA